MLVLLFAAHQGEEFVLILPAIMLVGAFIILRWANQPPADEESAEDKHDADEAGAADEAQDAPEPAEAPETVEARR